jgi:hypothetical protein
MCWIYIYIYIYMCGIESLNKTILKYNDDNDYKTFQNYYIFLYKDCINNIINIINILNKKINKIL